MPWTRNGPHPLAEEAARWLIELDEPRPEVLEKFAAWLETSPRHVEEFLLASAVWKELDDVDAGRRMEIRQLVDEARTNVHRLEHSDTTAALPRTPPARVRRVRLAGVAAAIALLAGAALWSILALAPEEYATSRGEQRALKLEDGSVIYLNTESRVEVRFSRAARDIRLLQGEAMFSVEHDPERPFRVMSGEALIQALGTRFNVYKSLAGTTVSVVEGLVAVAPTAATAERTPPPGSALTAPGGPVERVAAGEQARVSRTGEIVKHDVDDLDQIVAWRERRLVFRGEPLEHVAREFNRYNAVQIRVQGATVRQRRLTATFDADDPRSLADFLRRDTSLDVQDDGASQIVIRPRH